MIGLANFILEHREAVERDLLTETGHELRDVGGALSWGALNSFLRNIKLDSAVGQELNPEMSKWSTSTQTNAILADIYDLLGVINANLSVLVTHKKPKKPKPYPRPWKKDDTQHIGSGALSFSEMRNWIGARRERRRADSGDD